MHVIEPPNLVPYDGHGGKVQVFNAMLHPILRTNNEGELQSYILDSWEMSEDAKQVTLNLKKGIEWSDGTPLTAADLVMSLTHYLDTTLSPGLAPFISGVVGQAAFNSGEAESIDGLTNPNEHRVVVDLDEPNAGWLRSLAAMYTNVVLPAHVLGDVPHQDLENHAYFQDFTITSGPYSFNEWSSGQYIGLVRNENWSLGEAGFEQLFYKFIARDQASAQLETGDIQFNIGVDPVEANRLEQVEGVEVESTPTVSLVTWVLNHDEQLDDPRIRQAMSYAIDRVGICQAAYNGFCTPVVENVPHIAPDWAVPQDGLVEYEYDPERARELLEQAGWDSGTELVFLDRFEPGTAISRAWTIAQSNMADVGINWTIENVDFATQAERLEQSPDTWHGHGTHGANFTIDPSFIQSHLACGAAFPAGDNTGRYCNQELDELFDLGKAEADPDERAEIYRDAFRTINEDVPALYLLNDQLIVAYDSRLKGATGHGVFGDIYWNIGEWSWDD